MRVALGLRARARSCSVSAGAGSVRGAWRVCACAPGRGWGDGTCGWVVEKGGCFAGGVAPDSAGEHATPSRAAGRARGRAGGGEQEGWRRSAPRRPPPLLRSASRAAPRQLRAAARRTAPVGQRGQRALRVCSHMLRWAYSMQPAPTPPRTSRTRSRRASATPPMSPTRLCICWRRTWPSTTRSSSDARRTCGVAAQSRASTSTRWCRPRGTQSTCRVRARGWRARSRAPGGGGGGPLGFHR